MGEPGTLGDLDAGQDFAVLIRQDGCLHFVVEAPFSIEAAAAWAGAQSAYRVTRSRAGVRVEGHSTAGHCVLQRRSQQVVNPGQMLLCDQPLYLITSPLLATGSAS